MLRPYWTVCLAVLTAASLKDLANCDPLRKDMRNNPIAQKSCPKKTRAEPSKLTVASDCPPDAAFAGKASFDFTTANWDNVLDFWAVDEATANDKKRLDFDTDGNGVAMGMWKPGDAPTLVSSKYLLFGKVSVTLRAAKGNGLITAVVLKSDSGDEIDWELLGAYDNQAQTNYFYDGQALFNTYNDTYDLAASSFDAFQKYSLEWTDQFLSFSVNDTIRKVWYVGEIPAAKWPQTPMQVKLGVWSVRNDSDRGEIAWAGGVPDWGSAPYRGYFQSVEVEDYTGFCNQTDGYVEYQYDERTAGWQKIRIAGCQSRPGPELPAPSPVHTGDATATETGETGGRETTTAADDDNGGGAGLSAGPSSTLAAVLCLVWFLVL
ncbi:cell wall glucanosyltransferase Mwg1, partial [Metarhizium majus ARSEF 297]